MVNKQDKYGDPIWCTYDIVRMYVCTMSYVRMYMCTYVRMYVCTYVQRTCADKILAIRFWGGVGGANIKNLYTPLAPQTRRTTEY